jgi:hypothetical protein
MRASLSAALAGAALTSAFKVLHLTDVHVDPFYELNAIAGEGCYCDTHEGCARYPETCVITTNASLAAGPFGMPETNCATPAALWESAMEFVATNHSNSAIVLFTGDFGDAGLAAPCDSGVPDQAQGQIVDIIRTGVNAIRSVLPNAVVYGVLGNHDSSPGDVFDGSEGMQWLYSNLTSIFGASFPNDATALASLQAYGFYTTATQFDGLPIVALNTNYWTTLNPLLTNKSSAAYLVGQYQFEWLNQTLFNLAQGQGHPQAQSQGQPQRAWIIGHIPPHSGAWIDGFYTRYRQILSLYPSVVLSSFWGHDHVDSFSILRSCTAPPSGPGNGSDIQWVETTGIDWCSGGNFATGNIFDMGLYQNSSWCPLLPDAGGNATARIALCEGVCGPAQECEGFTFYPESMAPPYGTCCFRTDTSQKPVNASSPAECFEKAAAQPCGPGSDQGLSLQFGGPSLTEGYPAANPALRTFEIDDASFVPTEMVTYYGDIIAANADFAFTWKVEYDARLAFGMPDLSVASWEAVLASMVPDNSSSWSSYYVFNGKSYSGPSAPPACDTGACKEIAIGWLNGTSLPGAEHVVSK